MTQQSDTLPLHPDFLEANRAGQLPDAQRAALRRFDRGPIGNNLLVAALCLVVAVVLVVGHPSGPKAWLRPFAAVAALGAAAWLVRRSLGIGGRLAHDLAAGGVESVEGAIQKGRNSPSGAPDDTDVYYVEVGGRRFSVYPAVYRAAPDIGIVRLYYLPTSHHVVNLEQLADPPLPASLSAAPLDALKSIAPALMSHDGVARANAGATLAALENAIGLNQARAATPPPLSDRDPRPLGEAIIGR